MVYVYFFIKYVVRWFYAVPTAKVIWREDLGLKSQPKDYKISVRFEKKSWNCLPDGLNM